MRSLLDGEAIGDGVRFLPAGDTGLVVEFGNIVDRKLNEKVLNLQSALEAASLRGILDLVPTFRSLLVHYDPLQTDPETLIGLISPLLKSGSLSPRNVRSWEIPACYDEEYAPDLEDVAQRLGMKPSQVVDLHASQDYSVYVLGFLPGCALMGDLPVEMKLPRRMEPRVRVPAGSVAIAMQLTIVYPLVSPGGWHLIGNCPLNFFNVGLPRPNLLAPGDRVRFRPISAAEHTRLKAEQACSQVAS
jgi:KipI family sensor histidine kinase inhibitor